MKTTFVLIAQAVLLCSEAAGACGNGYSHCRTITFDHTKAGASDIPNYPALISGTYPYLSTIANGGFIQHTTQQTGGGAAITVPADLIFTSDSACGVRLPWEFESYDPAGGKVNIHVNIGALSHSADRTIYECMGNGSVTNWQGNVNGTWDSSYMMVQHLPDGTTLSANDSTGNANTAVIVPGLVATSGKIDGAALLPGFYGGQIPFSSGAAMSTGGALTMSAWVNLTDPSASNGSFVAKYASLMNGEYVFAPSGAGAAVYCLLDDITSGGYIGRIAPLPVTGFHYMVCTYDGGTTNAAIRIWQDGVQVDNANFGNGTFVQMRPTEAIGGIGMQNGLTGGVYKGVIDEVRLSSVDRTTSISAEYNNQSSPSTFYTVGLDAVVSTVVLTRRRIT